jgi:hypothetical protein
VTAPAAPVTERGHVGNTTAAGFWMLDEEETPELRWPLSVRVYDAMRRQDAQVGSVLRAVTLPVRRTPWRLDPAGARDEVVQLVAEDLGLPIVGAGDAAPGRTRDRFSWSEHLRLALLMLVHGHSFFEQVYRPPSEDPRGYARLRKLAWRPPRSIAAVNVAPDGGLVSIEQDPPQGGTRNVEIPVRFLVAYVCDREGANWFGNSLLRQAYKFWLIKDRELRVWATRDERNGVGVPLYEGAENETDLSKGLSIAQGYRAGSNAGAAIPNTAKLRLLGVEGALADPSKLVEKCDEQIARAVLAHFLNLGSQTGSWALGTTFADFFTMSLQAVALDVAAVANAHVVEDLVDINFGVDEPAPRIVFDEIGSGSSADAIKALVDSGVILPDRVLEEAVRQHLGLPPKAPIPGAPVGSPVGPAPETSTTTPAAAAGGTGS